MTIDEIQTRILILKDIDQAGNLDSEGALYLMLLEKEVCDRSAKILHFKNEKDNL